MAWKLLKMFNAFGFTNSYTYICITQKTIKPMSKNKLKRAMDAKRVIVVNERTIKDKSGNVKIISSIAPLNGGTFNAPKFKF